VSEMIAGMIRKQLSVVGIKFEYEVMSSADYAKRFQVYRVNKAAVPKGLDFIVNLVGNPIGHPGFHYLCLMSSDGIQSLTNDPALDTMLNSYFDASESTTQNAKLQEIEKYVFDHALIAPTYQVKSITAFRSNVILEDVSEDGNFIGPFISKIKKRAP
jgi:ABC-type transport system substrate-binding protein